jgi:hypothetical protein
MFPDPITMAQPLFPNLKTNLVGSEEKPGILLVDLKMADKKLGMIGIERAIRLATGQVVYMYFLENKKDTGGGGGR